MGPENVCLETEGQFNSDASGMSV